VQAFEYLQELRELANDTENLRGQQAALEADSCRPCSSGTVAAVPLNKEVPNYISQPFQSTIVSPALTF
jgi:hypothetical protein